MQPASVHYLALTNVHGQQKYAICLTQFAKHSVSKVTFTCHKYCFHINTILTPNSMNTLVSQFERYCAFYSHVNL